MIFAATAVIIVFAIVLIGLVLPKDFAFQRDIVIGRPLPAVFAFLRLVKNQDQWNPWSRRDPKIAKVFRGEDGTIGFIYAWAGPHAGEGEQETTSIRDGQRIDFELRFQKPFQSTSGAYLKTEAAGPDQTRVSWGMTGRSPFPMNLMHFLMKGKLAKDFDEGLRTLKGLLESGS